MHDRQNCSKNTSWMECVYLSQLCFQIRVPRAVMTIRNLPDAVRDLSTHKFSLLSVTAAPSATSTPEKNGAIPNSAITTFWIDQCEAWRTRCVATQLVLEKKLEQVVSGEPYEIPNEEMAVQNHMPEIPLVVTTKVRVIARKHEFL